MATVSDRHAGGRPRQLERNQLGKRIESLAARKGIRMDELAELAGISVPSLYRIATGTTPDPKVSTVNAIATALGTTIDALIKEKAQPVRGTSRSCRKTA